MTTVLESLNLALHDVMATDDRACVLGEDILDPYGGAFKVTKGLSTKFPDRVTTTPISEAAIVGMAAGMALRGWHPIVEIMFGDFTTLVVDQVVNHASKFRWMYNEQVRVPLVIRTPMGGRRGYGPTHSQSLEKLFLGVPGLRVVAPTAAGDPGALLCSAVADDEPVLFVEHKVLYLHHLWETDADFDVTRSGPEHAPHYLLGVRHGGRPTVTVVAYGHMAELAREAVARLAYELELFVELVVPTGLAPFDVAPVLESVRRTGALLVAEEGTVTAGWGAEVLARVVEEAPTLRAVRRVAAPDHPIPSSGAMEDLVLPGVDLLVKTAQELAA